MRIVGQNFSKPFSIDFRYLTHKAALSLDNFRKDNIIGPIFAMKNTRWMYFGTFAASQSQIEIVSLQLGHILKEASEKAFANLLMIAIAAVDLQAQTIDDLQKLLAHIASIDQIACIQEIVVAPKLEIYKMQLIMFRPICYIYLCF